MLVSAVIPTFNYAHFVGRAIDSVLAQTFSRDNPGELECVVVDDGSTDDTPATLARYGDRIRVVRQENQGLSAARNAGIAAARGSLVAFLDADDHWKPEKIDRQVKVLTGQPEVGVVGCGAENVDGNGRFLKERHAPAPPPGNDGVRAVALRTHWVGASGSGAMVRKSIFDDVGGFDETLRAAEDWDMWMRLCAHCRIVNLPQVLATIVLHGTGTFRNAAKMEANQWRVYDKAIERWPGVLDEIVRRKMRAAILEDVGHEYLHAGQFREAAERYARSVKAWPLKRRRWYLTARTTVRAVRQMALG